MENTTSNLVLTAKIEGFKVIARNALRMELINPRLSTIASLEGNIKDIKKDIEAANHRINVMNYEISKLDTAHPNYTKIKESKEKDAKDMTPMIERFTKMITDTEKAIADQKIGITKIETGETKVSADKLHDVVNALIHADALNQVKA